MGHGDGRQEEMAKVNRMWRWGHGGGQEHLEMVEGTEEVRERGQGGAGGDHGP